MYSWSSGPQSTGGKNFGDFMSSGMWGINTGTQGLDWKVIAALGGAALVILLVLRRK